MQLPGSMNMAPPPEIRRTTRMPCRCGASMSTSLRTDWNDPITTSELVPVPEPQHGRRRPAATSCGMHLVERQVHHRVHA